MDAAPPGRCPRGGGAERPREIPLRGWKDILVRTWREVEEDRVSMVAAAMAFYGVLAVFPAVIALVSLYALVSDPGQIEGQLGSALETVPPSARALLTDYLSSAARRSDSSLGWGTLVGLLGALWSTSTGTHALIRAVNLAYDERETRGFVKMRFSAIALTLGGVLFGAVSIFTIALLPGLMGYVGLAQLTRDLIHVGRWPILMLAAIFAIGVLYRVAPDRPPTQWRWITPGSVVATVLWLLASWSFSLYVENFGSFGDTYGPIAGVIVLMLWFWLTSLAILLGAELNSEIEAQIRRDQAAGSGEPTREPA